MSASTVAYLAAVRTAIALLRAGQEPDIALFTAICRVEEAGIRATAKELRRDRVAEAKRLALNAYLASGMTGLKASAQRLEQLEAYLLGTRLPHCF
jgi:hypothetical protein